MVQRVYILGAGFSYVAAGLPMLKQLGDLTLPALEDDGFAVKGRDLEEVMSRLSENQPDLSEAENLRNRSRFLELTERISDALSDDFGRWKTAPDWLASFVALAHLEKSTIITFNYDTVIETILWNHELRDDGQRVLEDHVFENLPPTDSPSRYEQRPVSSFSLLKLHGSLNWWWVPGDRYGASIVRQPADRSAPRPPGRERFIVPPTATKTTLYTSSTLREIWRRSRLALEGADEVVIIGYSLPLTDIAVRSLIAEAIPPTTAVKVVDLYPDEIEKRLKQMSIKNTSTISGEDCIESLVRNLEFSAARRLVDQLRKATAEPDTLLVVGLSNSGVARAVTDMIRQHQVVTLNRPGGDGGVLSLWKDERYGEEVRAEVSAGG